jgi:hypothetical protein
MAETNERQSQLLGRQIEADEALRQRENTAAAGNARTKETNTEVLCPVQF